MCGLRAKSDRNDGVIYGRDVTTYVCDFLRILRCDVHSTDSEMREGGESQRARNYLLSTL